MTRAARAIAWALDRVRAAHGESVPVRKAGKKKAASPIRFVRDKNALETALAAVQSQIENTYRLATRGVIKDRDWVAAEVKRLEGQKAARVRQSEAQDAPTAPSRCPRLTWSG